MNNISIINQQAISQEEIRKLANRVSSGIWKNYFPDVFGDKKRIVLPYKMLQENMSQFQNVPPPPDIVRYLGENGYKISNDYMAYKPESPNNLIRVGKVLARLYNHNALTP